MKPWCGTAGVFLFLTAGSVSGQQPGDTVRVSGGLVDTVVEADSSGLFLSSGYALYAEMQSLELWAGTEGRPWRGFKYGFLVGATLGVAAGVSLCFSVGDCSDFDYVQVGGGLGAVGGVAVGVVGAVIGTAVKSDIWEPVLIPGGFSLRLTVGG